MTATIRVTSLEEALDLAYRRLPQAMRAAIKDLFRLIETDVLPISQKEVWDAGLAELSELTQESRRLRLGYYRAVRPNSRARDDRPAFEWSGRVREASQRFARIERDRAIIDPDRTYKGPLRARYGDRVFSNVVKTNRLIHDLRRIERLIGRELWEKWLRKSVFPRLRRGGITPPSFGDSAVDRGEVPF